MTLLLSQVITYIGALILLGGAAILAHYWILALVSLFGRHDPPRAGNPARNRFLIVVPAHDEEHQLMRTLQACKRLDYPADCLSVLVIADNCTDQTASIARKQGVRVIERNSPELRGKGHALEYALNGIAHEDHDAVLIVDADCRLDPRSLQFFDSHLQAGGRVLQASYVAANPDDSPISYALAVGNYLENNVLYAPLARIGGSALLRGTGMVFHRHVLQRFPWRARSVVEDVEYALTLARAGIPVRFVADAAVYSDFPSDEEQLRVQRTRWSGGHFSLTWRRAIALICEGVYKRRPSLVGFGWTMLTVSRPLLVLVVLLGLLVQTSRLLLRPDAIAVAGFACAWVLTALLVGYFALGILGLGLTTRRLRLLLRAPLVVFRLMAISVRGVLGVGRDAWIRTPRSRG